jgi:hypothetical protein
VSERRRPLPQLSPARARIDVPTIMDRTLAAAHGARYVQLAAFAIDVDRVYVSPEADDAAAELPFGWEVFLVQEYARERLPASDPSVLALLEETCLAILAQPPDQQGFGSQLAFAVHDAVLRGDYPGSLSRAFARWRGRPHRQLVRALEGLRAERERVLPRLARHCLDHAPAPGLAPPTRDALQDMAVATRDELARGPR